MKNEDDGECSGLSIGSGRRRKSDEAEPSSSSSDTSTSSSNGDGNCQSPANKRQRLHDMSLLSLKPTLIPVETLGNIVDACDNSPNNSSESQEFFFDGAFTALTVPIDEENSFDNGDNDDDVTVVDGGNSDVVVISDEDSSRVHDVISLSSDEGDCNIVDPPCDVDVLTQIRHIFPKHEKKDQKRATAKKTSKHPTGIIKIEKEKKKSKPTKIPSRKNSKETEVVIEVPTLTKRTNKSNSKETEFVSSSGSILQPPSPDSCVSSSCPAENSVRLDSQMLALLVEDSNSADQYGSTVDQQKILTEETAGKQWNVLDILTPEPVDQQMTILRNDKQTENISENTGIEISTRAPEIIDTLDQTQSLPISDANIENSADFDVIQSQEENVLKEAEDDDDINRKDSTHLQSTKGNDYIQQSASNFEDTTLLAVYQVPEDSTSKQNTDVANSVRSANETSSNVLLNEVTALVEDASSKEDHNLQDGKSSTAVTGSSLIQQNLVAETSLEISADTNSKVGTMEISTSEVSIGDDKSLPEGSAPLNMEQNAASKKDDAPKQFLVEGPDDSNMSNQLADELSGAAVSSDNTIQHDILDEPSKNVNLTTDTIGAPPIGVTDKTNTPDTQVNVTILSNPVNVYPDNNSVVDKAQQGSITDGKHPDFSSKSTIDNSTNQQPKDTHTVKPMSKKSRKKYNMTLQGMGSLLSTLSKDPVLLASAPKNQSKDTDSLQNTSDSQQGNSGVVSPVEEQENSLTDVDKKCQAVVDEPKELVEDMSVDMESTICELKSVNEPKLIGTCRKEFCSSYENYLRGCWWSPDGEVLLTNSDDNIMRLFRIPNKGDDMAATETDEMKPALRMSEGETIYDMCWYPYMTSSDLNTCCFLTTSRDHPVHLWDSVTGRIRCSYRAFDQMDELSSAHSVAFSDDGSKIYCGFNKCIRIFDSARPGRQFVEKSTVQSKNRYRKNRHEKSLNQTGIISAIAFSNQYCGLYALGSFQKTVGLYTTNTDEPVFLLKEHQGGITQLKFTSDGFYLFSGGRKDPEIICWDMRNTSMPLFKAQREVTTNQRIQFDIDVTSTYMFSGSTNHVINIWNIRDIMAGVGEEVVTHPPMKSFQAHNDVVNGISLQPSGKILASTSGQRHFLVDDVSDSESDDITDDVTAPFQANLVYDNSLKLWSL